MTHLVAIGSTEFIAYDELVVGTEALVHAELSNHGVEVTVNTPVTHIEEAAHRASSGVERRQRCHQSRSASSWIQVVGRLGTEIAKRDDTFAKTTRVKQVSWSL